MRSTKASLFATCIVDQFYPEVGSSTVRVLRKLGVDLDFPNRQTCCGQPAFNSGFWNEAKPIAKQFIEIFSESPNIVIPSGSCAAMARIFFKELFHDDNNMLNAVEKLTPKIYELSEFIVDVLGVSSFETITNVSPPKSVTYHEACHLKRELLVTTQPRKLISSIQGINLIEMSQADVCCGFGGTFSLKYPDISWAILQDKVKNVQNAEVEAVVSSDMGCLMQIEGGLNKQNVDTRCLHLAQLLDESISRL